MTSLRRIGNARRNFVDTDGRQTILPPADAGPCPDEVTTERHGRQPEMT